MLVFQANGMLLKQWKLRDAVSTSVVLADLTRDNIPEVITRVWYPSGLLVSSLDGFTIPTQIMHGNFPIVAKLTQEHSMNILSNSNTALNDSGFIYAYNSDGSSLSWSPLRVPGFPMGKNIFADVNRDGKIELITVTEQGINPAIVYLYAWTFPYSSSSQENLQWPMFQHDRYRTSQYGFVPPDELVSVPEFQNNFSQFSLAQNYPNPFNPTTTIRFEIPVGAIHELPLQTTLKIYNILGQEVATLLNNEEMEIGEHEITFDASGLTSGVYFYRLQVSQDGILRYSETRKLLLIK